MSAAKHTPAPWHADEPYIDNGRDMLVIAIRDDEANLLAEVVMENVDDEAQALRPMVAMEAEVSEQTHANAKLIVAAPALADALERILFCVKGQDEDVSGAIGEAGAALSLAGRLP